MWIDTFILSGNMKFLICFKETNNTLFIHPLCK